jgi:hypothetical protein
MWPGPNHAMDQCSLSDMQGNGRPAAGTYLIRGDLITMVKNSSSSTPGTGGATLLYHPIIVEH